MKYFLTIQPDGGAYIRRLNEKRSIIANAEKALGAECKTFMREESPVVLASGKDAELWGLLYNYTASLYTGEHVYGDAVVLAAYDSEAEAREVYNDICEFVDSLEET